MLIFGKSNLVDAILVISGSMSPRLLLEVVHGSFAFIFLFVCLEIIVDIYAYWLYIRFSLMSLTILFFLDFAPYSLMKSF